MKSEQSVSLVSRITKAFSRINVPVTLSRAVPMRAVVGIFLVGAALVGSYVFDQQNAGDPQAKIQEETQALLAQVSQLIVLPPNEVPTVATVSDPDRLKDQAFFANAKKGDKVLIFSQARRAILYDPVAHKIVEVAPISVGNGQTPLPQ